jgi:hypothetical protein
MSVNSTKKLAEDQERALGLSMRVERRLRRRAPIRERTARVQRDDVKARWAC